MNRCKSCDLPASHPFGLAFDQAGVCSGCLESRDYRFNGEAKSQLLEQVAAILAARRHRNEDFDCIVPVSGDKEAFTTVQFVINELGLRPLGCSFNHHFNTNVGLYNLEALKHYFDLEIVEFTPAVDVYREIARADLINFGNLNRFNAAAQKSFPVILAERHNIPLVIWGKHQGVSYTGMFARSQDVKFSPQYWRMFDADKLDENNDCYAELTADARELVKRFMLGPRSNNEFSNVTGLFLSHHLNWSTASQTKSVVDNFNVKSGASPRSFQDYEYCGHYFYNSWHDVFRQIKFGYGKVREQCAEMIRNGLLSIEAARELVSIFEAVRPSDLDVFGDFFELSSKNLQDLFVRFDNYSRWSDFTRSPDEAREKASVLLQEPGLLRAHALEGPYTFKKTLNHEWSHYE